MIFLFRLQHGGTESDRCISRKHSDQEHHLLVKGRLSTKICSYRFPVFAETDEWFSLLHDAPRVNRSLPKHAHSEVRKLFNFNRRGSTGCV